MSERTLIVTYHIQSTADEIEDRAEAVALEQSVELPRAAVPLDELSAPVVGEVVSIQRLDEDRFAVDIRFSPDLTGMDAAQMANVLFGNSSLQPTVTLTDVALPDEVAQGFGGPRHGINGLRGLTNSWGRPLTCTALKPVGLSPDQLADRCRVFAEAGIDIIKDDHGLADQHFAPFAQRVKACQSAVNEVNAARDSRIVYAPNLMGGPSALFEQARICREEGVQAVMLAPMLIGLSTFTELLREHLPMPILAHPAFAGAQRIDPAFQLGKWFRMLGADAVIFPNYGGRFSYSPEICRRLADNLRGGFGTLEPSLPTPAGGMKVDRVDELVRFYGSDVMLLIGGSLYMAGDELLARSRTFVNNVATATERLR